MVTPESGTQLMLVPGIAVLIMFCISLRNRLKGKAQVEIIQAPIVLVTTVIGCMLGAYGAGIKRKWALLLTFVGFFLPPFAALMALPLVLFDIKVSPEMSRAMSRAKKTK